MSTHTVMPVTGEEVSVEGGSAVAGDAACPARRSVLQAGERHDDFEGGTRSQLRLDRFVHHGVVGVFA